MQVPSKVQLSPSSRRTIRLQLQIFLYPEKELEFRKRLYMTRKIKKGRNI
jgi:hypothetical protein